MSFIIMHSIICMVSFHLNWMVQRLMPTNSCRVQLRVVHSNFSSAIIPPCCRVQAVDYTYVGWNKADGREGYLISTV